MGHSTSKKWWSYIVMFATCVVTVFPALDILLGSFKPESQIYATNSSGLALFPHIWTLSNYQSVFNSLGTTLWRWLFNSVVVSFMNAALAIVICIAGAYVIVRYNFWGKKVIYFAILFTMLMPPELQFIPVFQMFKSAHLVNTYPGIFLAGIANAFGFFMLTQFFENIPKDLFDAAVVDGSGDFQIIRNIVLPNSRNAIIVLFTVLFIQQWNNYFWPLIITNKQSMYTLALGVAQFQGGGTSWQNPGEVMAIAVLSMIPIVVIYLFIHRHMAEGISMSGIK